RRRHTRSYGDWSSDVCSSDLCVRSGQEVPGEHAEIALTRGIGRDDVHHDRRYLGHATEEARDAAAGEVTALRAVGRSANDIEGEIGRASCRERVERGEASETV